MEAYKRHHILKAWNTWFSRFTADVFPPRYCPNTHLHAPDQQTTKTSTFIEVVLPVGDQLFNVFDWHHLASLSF